MTQNREIVSWRDEDDPELQKRQNRGLMVQFQHAITNRVQELIGVKRRITIGWRDPGMLHNSSPETEDTSVPDYIFWDKARRGKARGLEISGLFLKPLCSKIAAWAMGIPPVLESQAEKRSAAEKINEHLNDWWDEHLPEILKGYEEALNLGNCYLVVNGDLSVTILPPHVVDRIIDETDFSKTLGWRVTLRYVNPADSTDAMTIVDEYRVGSRIRYFYRNGEPIKTQTYKLPLNRLNIIPILNRYGVDEVFGRPEGEGLIPDLQAYGEVIQAGIQGNVRQGRPTPVIEGLGTEQSIKSFWERMGKTIRRILPDGSVEQTTTANFDADKLVTLGGDAKFNWKSPGLFASETARILELLFYMMLQHTEIPEFVWGNAVTSSKASAETQLAPFLKWLQKKQGLSQGWITNLAQVVIEMFQIEDPTLVVTGADKIKIVWKPLTEQDGKLRLDVVKLGLEQGLLTREKALELCPTLDVDDADQWVADAEKQKKEDSEETEAAVLAQVSKLANASGATNKTTPSKPTVVPKVNPSNEPAATA